MTAFIVRFALNQGFFLRGRFLGVCLDLAEESLKPLKLLESIGSTSYNLMILIPGQQAFKIIDRGMLWAA